MVERKSTVASSGDRKVNFNIEIEAVNDAKPARPKLVEVALLSLADEQDSGGDPYNSTGQFCRLPQQDEE
jgi:hypothetical protein